jgi:AraC-like DNA-binding protein
LPRSAAATAAASAAAATNPPGRFHAQLQGGGLDTLLDTDDFGCWEALVAATLGHHRSELRDAREPFKARFRSGRIGGFSLLHIQGRGRLRLSREQRQHSVLWLPLHGMTQERVNGTTWLAEPGTGLLFHPGDAMEGDTSEELEGISILLPQGFQPPALAPASPLLAAGPQPQRVLAAARQLAAAAAQRPEGADHAADRLSQALWDWWQAQGQPLERERITSRRRRHTVAEARQWMLPRLQERFSVVELSAAVQVSPRQLQYCFLQELGRSPMAEAKRLRLQRLRALLQDPAQARRSVAELMLAAGLIASGVTSADYRRWCGESPRRTRRALGAAPAP